MKTGKLEHVKADGWKVGSAEDFLQLSDKEAQLVVALKRNLLQTDLAQRMKSSQSRIVKIEAGKLSLALDLIVLSLIASSTTTCNIQGLFTAKK